MVPFLIHSSLKLWSQKQKRRHEGQVHSRKSLSPSWYAIPVARLSHCAHRKSSNVLDGPGRVSATGPLSDLLPVPDRSGHSCREAMTPSGNKRPPNKVRVCLSVESGGWCQVVFAMYMVFVKSVKLVPTEMLCHKKRNKIFKMHIFGA